MSITGILIEVAAFDFQKFKNPSIEGPIIKTANRRAFGTPGSMFSTTTITSAKTC